MRLLCDTRLPGRHTLTLDAPPGTFRLWQTSNTNGTPLLVPGQTITNGAPLTFTAPDDATVWVEAVSNDTASVTFAFEGTGNARGFDFADTLKITAVAVGFTPVCTNAAPDGYAYNPCAIEEGGTAQYCIDVKPDTLPDHLIEWSNLSFFNRVSFPHGNTGRVVTVRGDAVGPFWLGVDIKTATPAPVIGGQVLPPTNTIPVTVWIVRDDNGNNAAITTNRVHELIAGLNKIYRQPVMKYELADEIMYTNRTEWLNLTQTDGICPEADTMLRSLYKNSPRGLKICLVNSITGIETSPPQTFLVGGFNSRRGIVLATGHPGLPLTRRVFGHEVGHACGKRDIYVSDPATPLTVTGPVSENRLPRDWSGGWNYNGGYYPPGLTQADLIAKNLLMFGLALGEETDNCIDIPLGGVYGLWYDLNDNRERVWQLGIAPVGLEEMLKQRYPRQPNHR